MPVPPDVPGQAAAAGRAGQEPGEPVLAAADPAAVPPAVPRPHRLDVLPGCWIDERPQGGRLAGPQAARVERVGQHPGVRLAADWERTGDGGVERRQLDPIVGQSIETILDDLKLRRPQEVAFRIAKRVLDTYFRAADDAEQLWLFPQILTITSGGWRSASTAGGT